MATIGRKLFMDEIKYVNTPAEEFGCPICLGILQEPYLTACCGNHFCEACVSKVKEGASKCPLCQQSPLNGMLNKGMKRKVNELKVYCMYKNAGCKWIGELGKLEQHLAPGKIDGECRFVNIKCPTSEHCKSEISRKSLTHHITSKCKYRMFQCEHCGYQSTYLVVTTEHYHHCSNYPILCPNNCTKQTYPRDQLDNHLASCPEQEVDCTFSEMGCNEKIKRQLLQKHLESNLLQHQLMMCQAYTVQKETINSLHKSKRELEKQVAYLTKESAEAEKRTNWPLYLIKMSQIISIYPVAPIILEVTCTIEIARHSPKIYSLPFYSHHNGYKMQLSLEIENINTWYMLAYTELPFPMSMSIPNNSEYNDNIHCALVGLHIMDGEHDSHLKWPFENTITVTLLNSHTNDHHYTAKKCYHGTKNSQLKSQLVKSADLPEAKRASTKLEKVKNIPKAFKHEVWNEYKHMRSIDTPNSLIFHCDDVLKDKSKLYFEVTVNTW